jgi:AraC-like DNA-binding protein
LDISERHLSRGFHATFGISPKQYARLARIEKVIAARKSGLGWANVAYACGFTDQAHLIHDFGTIVGGTPAEFFGAARSPNFRGGDAVPILTIHSSSRLVTNTLASTAAWRDAAGRHDGGATLIHRSDMLTACP